MIDLTQKGLPNAIYSENGNPILLNTDFRHWIRFQNDIQRDNEDRDISYIFKDYSPPVTPFIWEQLKNFLYNPNTTPKNDSSAGERILDYLQDGEYIFSALYATYGIDITEIDMHWHKFQALCNNIIGEDTLWGYAKTVRGYKKPSKSDTPEKAYTKAREAWSFPIQLTVEEQEKINEFEEYFS